MFLKPDGVLGAAAPPYFMHKCKIPGPQFELGLSLVRPLLCSVAIVAQDSSPEGSFVSGSKEFCLVFMCGV